LQESQLEEFKQELLATTSLEQLGKYHAQIRGLEEALKNYHDVSFTTLHRVMSIRLEAERHLGGLLLALPRRQGARAELKETSVHNGARSFEGALLDLNVTKSTALRWQWLARVPKEGFDYYIAETRARGWLPSRSRAIKEGWRIANGKGMGEVLTNLARRAVLETWPDVGEARILLKEGLSAFYGADLGDAAAQAINQVVAGRLFSEVEGRIYVGEMDAEQARARTREFAQHIAVDADSWRIVDRVIEQAAQRAIPEYRAEIQQQQKVRAEATYRRSRRDELAPRLNPVLGVLGQLDRLPMDPRVFVALLKEAREPEEVEVWRQRIENARCWLDQVLAYWESVAPDSANGGDRDSYI
jgi:hypothetical protein